MSLIDKAKQALNTQKGEEISDKILDKAAQVAEEKLGADKAGHVRTVRDKIDEQIGTPGEQPAPADAPEARREEENL